MAPKLLKYLAMLKVKVELSRAQRNKIANCAGAPNTRAAPPAIHDAKIGMRINYGRKIMVDCVEHQQYHVLLNKNAENRTIKELEAKFPNKKWATASIPTNTEDIEDKEEVVGGLFDDLQDDLVDTINEVEGDKK